ncbi:MAG TPA: cyclopropane-fatty-acyl-phospholipid synthase family protein [Aquabacterium sp.]|uniref:cyclopropane-fatty-acyl-phospholipid synthase family protein n=1 Tax=Aquabacterium sp. TaxID=1872578 RepID=UPI002E37C441|nr:cyclopropane-fatty-acyl-phospholipid synthase family protein [Aquabacterium sp.]HEX5373233.1 cyclopropane-fatty-acyl-phospholipid synthase family protein [Aquabacterium sp.]
MNTSTLRRSPSDASTRAMAQLPRQAPASAKVVFKLLQRLSVGSLDVQWPDGSTAHFGQPGAEPRAALRLKDWRLCAMALKSGDIGFAESYIAGSWTTPHLTDLIKVLIANREQIESVIYGHWLGRLAYRIKHLLNHNSKANSRKNIHAHYDLGNDFYRLWLDPTMNYSSAWFNGRLDQPLPVAQTAKVCRALREVGVLGGAPGQRVLEIGCGWGALAEVAAQEARARVTGVTLSTEQLAWARERLKDAPAGLVDLRLQDYRDILDEPFDAIVSIEMFEAVGQAYWPTYFSTVSRLLKPGGRACIQTITIRDDLFERYSRSTDFIQQYIFPGGMLPSDAQFRQQAERAGLRVVQTESFGRDYAETLRRWRAAFLSQESRVARLGFDQRFMRIWEFYLCYCEAAFDTDNTGVVQYTLVKD